MKTPAGSECKFYYHDFQRGRTTQECRLIQSNADSRPWRPKLCQTCPVPAILRANACPNMQLTAWVARRCVFFGQVRVRAFCTLSERKVDNPAVGCGRCHEAQWRTISEQMRRAGNQDAETPGSGR